MRLRQEKPELVVAESTLREYVRQRKVAMGLLGHEVFVPQSYQYGGEAQVDWFEIWAEFDGLPRKVYLFCMRSMASGAAFHRAYPHATQQAFLPPQRHGPVAGGPGSKPTSWRSRGSAGLSHSPIR